MTIKDDRLWRQFVRGWLKLGLAVRDPVGLRLAAESRERHLAAGKDLRSLWDSRASTRDLIAYARWELIECMDSLDPEPRIRGDVDDPFHAGCCAMRALGALTRLERLLPISD